ncbi:MAG: hypothetical protein AAGK97_17950, partial [Bacteroidota bacterium]
KNITTSEILKRNTQEINKSAKKDNSNITKSLSYLNSLNILKINSTSNLDIDLSSFNHLALQRLHVNNNSKHLQWSVKLEGGISAINRTLRNISVDTSALRLLGIKEDYTKPLEANHFGISLNAQMNSGLYFGIGIQHTSLIERYQIQDTKVVTDSVFGVIVYRENPVGDTVAIMGMKPRTTTTTFDKTIYNSFNLLDIPITVGYTLFKEAQWNLQLEGTALLNLALNTEGILPDINFEDISIEENQDQFYKAKLGIRYQIGLNFNWDLSDHINVSVGTRAQFFPNSISSSNNPLTREYTLFGGNLGLSYKF